MERLEARTRNNGLREVALALVVAFAYFLTRGLIRGRQATAVAHAYALLGAEGVLHIAVERPLQAFALRHLTLVQVTDASYVLAHLPLLIGVAIWLFARHQQDYRRFRTAFLISAAIGLVVYVLYPVAPPRFLPGFVDTEQRYAFNIDGSGIRLFYNPYAAMPSLHVAWALLAGVAIAACARHRGVRLLGAILPIGMVLTVLITGNHFVLDVAAGCAVALMALAIASAPLRLVHSRRRDRKPAFARGGMSALLRTGKEDTHVVHRGPDRVG